MNAYAKSLSNLTLVFIAALVACFGICMLAGCQRAEESAPEPATSEPAIVEDRSSSTEVEVSVSPTSEITTGDTEVDAAVEAKLASMTTEQKVAQLFVARAESLCSDGSTLTYVDDDVRSNVAAIPVAGICLLGDNLADPEQTRSLLSELQAASQETIGLDMLLCVDEEGGTVARIGSNPAFGVSDAGDMRAIGNTGDTSAAQDAAKAMGTYLFDLGFNVDFAPVADVDTDEATTMEQRSFGTDAALVADMVGAQVQGFAEAGVLCSAKHFPGIGSAIGDSHEEGITLDKDIEALRETDLVPFKAAVDAKVPMIMVGHISCPQIMGDTLPATFSRAVMTGLIRDELGYTGVVITDSLGMGAATEVYGEAEAPLRAFEAGADLLLMPGDLNAGYQAILDAVNSGEVTQERLDQSVTRILGMKLLYEKQTKDKREAAEKAAEEEAAKQAEEEAKRAEEEAANHSTASAANLNLAEDYRSSFVHGDKGAQYQKYIVLHDTEGTGDAYSVINYWDGNGAGVAAHFVVNTDGSVVQCVPLDKITHHAGFGDAGHNAQYGVEDESRDDKVGTVPIGDWAPDYGMNSYSVGIEMVHVSGGVAYTEAQLNAVDAVIAYIDSYYGFESTIIDHKAWRTGNSDTSPEFAGYLANYQDHRTHN